MALKNSAVKYKLPVLPLLAIAAFAYFFWLMLQLTLNYVPYNTNVAFLMIKQTEVTTLAAYRYIFYTHVYTSIFALFFGFFQFFSFGSSAGRTFHRYSGYAYVVILLLFSAPSGLYMGIYANGGTISKIAFTILSLLWWFTTWKAMQCVNRNNFTAHRNWMIRSYALCVSAVTLRIWKVSIVYLFYLPPMDVYKVIAWMGWVPNLIVAELIIYYNFKRLKPKHRQP